MGDLEAALARIVELEGELVDARAAASDLFPLRIRAQELEVEVALARNELELTRARAAMELEVARARSSAELELLKAELGAREAELALLRR